MSDRTIIKSRGQLTNEKSICPGNKSRATFSWDILESVICIVDQDTGSKSVTNDAENVLCDIARAEGWKILELPIIYRDSEGNWDGMKPVIGSNRVIDVNFYSVGERDVHDAIDFLRNME